MSHPRRVWLLVALPLVAATFIACGGGNGGDSVTAREATSGPVTASPTRTPRTTASPTTTGVVAATPTPTATPDEQVASTFSIPTIELPLATMTRRDDATFDLPIEVPPREEYTVGLSGRYQLNGRGMLFWYPELVRRTFWMKDTHIDLSIAFVDDTGTIVDMFDMEAESTEYRTPEHFYQFAIEAPLGWYADRGVTVGDTVTLDFEIPEFLRQ